MVVAENGLQAVEAVKAQRFDVVLMDVQMPEMDGLQATAAIRTLERDSGTRTPIVALTARAITADRERCFEAGMDCYISKPFRPQELIATIERLVSPDAAEPMQDPSITQQTIASSASRPAARPLASTAEVIDVAALNARVEDDAELLAEMIELFLEAAPRLFGRDIRRRQAARFLRRAALGTCAQGSHAKHGGHARRPSCTAPGDHGRNGRHEPGRRDSGGA